jgi:2-hydroxy-3-oxopropionate reductase
VTVVGFVGAGVMGAPMIHRLVRAGHHVKGFARSDASRARIREAAAELVDEPADVCEGADAVITMLPDSPDVRTVVLAEGGLATRLRSGQVFLDMSTVSPATAREVAERLARQGVDCLDAPVSGGEQAAIEGTLSIMVGGRGEALDRVRPLLACLGSSTTHVGPVGSGQLTKAANQLVVAANLQAVAEAVVFLERAGVDLQAALTAIAGGLAGSTVLQRKRENFLAADFRPGFRVALHDKDLGIVMETAREQTSVLPLTALVSQLMAASKARGDGDLDHSALLRLLRELNPSRP